MRIQTQILRKVNRRAPVPSSVSVGAGPAAAVPLPGGQSVHVGRFNSRAEYEAALASDPFVPCEVCKDLTR